MLKVLYESFIKALIRFWDNKFIRNNEVDYLRMELEKSNQRYNELLERFLNPPVQEVEVSNDEQQPINGFKTWEQKRRELELASFLKFKNMNETKSIEQLEEELLVTRES